MMNIVYLLLHRQYLNKTIYLVNNENTEKTMKREKIITSIPYIVIGILITLILIFISCEKDSLPVEEKCYICVEMANSKTIKTWEVCDVLEAAKINDSRWITYVWSGNVKQATVHTINCK